MIRTSTLLVAAAGLLAASAPVHAQQYPARPVRVIVGLAPGGGTDVSARILAQKLSDQLGHSFVVDNRPGAGSLLGIELTIKATPDGYTLLFASPELAVNPSLMKKASYDPVKDLAPIVRTTEGQYIMSARLNLPAANVREFIALAKAQPKAFNYASSGTGSANHLAGELFKSMAGIEMVHVPYKGAGPAGTAMLAGEVQIMFSSTTAVIPHVRSGRLKALAVTGPKRSFIVPDIPTVSESGLPGFEVVGWYGLLAPAATPPAIVQRLNAAVNQVLPDLRERYADLGSEPVGGTPADFVAFLRREGAKWPAVIKASGARAD